MNPDHATRFNDSDQQVSESSSRIPHMMLYILLSLLLVTVVIIYVHSKGNFSRTALAVNYIRMHWLPGSIRTPVVLDEGYQLLMPAQGAPILLVQIDRQTHLGTVVIRWGTYSLWKTSIPACLSYDAPVNSKVRVAVNKNGTLDLMLPVNNGADPIKARWSVSSLRFEPVADEDPQVGI